jgi:superfamily II DNA or RNA helicase
MACGTGKTLTGLWVDANMNAQRTLVLLPTLSLLGQTLRAWAAEAQAPFSYLAVCSDATVTTGLDAFISHTADLGIPVTTDAAQVSEFLCRSPGKSVVFATYQSSRVVASAQEPEGAPSFDLVIADEAHRCAGAGDGPFATVLDGARIRAGRRLFMTATPRYVSSRAKTAAEDRAFPVASMDDEEKFGGVLHSLSFATAIERDLLADYQVVVIGVGDGTYRDFVARRALVTRDGDEVEDASTLAAQVGLLKAMRRFDLRRVVSFHSRVSASSAFAAGLPSLLTWMPEDARPVGPLWARHVDGTMSAGLREAALLRLARLQPGERGLLANVRCLGEGVDVPAIDAVAFMDPRSSLVDIIQAVGRAIRRSTEKRFGTIVIPVVVAEGQTADEVLESSAFKPVWDVVRALRAHDEELAEILDSARRRMGRTGSAGELPTKLKIIDIPERVGTNFVEAFTAKLVETTTSPWEFGYGVLEGYVAREGSAATIRKSTVEDGYPLGAWVARQRNRRNDPRWPLSKARRARLERVQGWRWYKHDLSWERGLTALETFVGEHGHARVPAEYVSEDGVALGYWVKRQRGKRAGTREGRLTQSQIDRLNSFAGWAWDAHSAKWEDGFAVLTQYVLREGHASPPHDHVEERFVLGSWVRRQREARVARDKRGVLDAERQRRLERLPGWQWDAKMARRDQQQRERAGEVDAAGAQPARRGDQHDRAWDRGLAALRTYAVSFGHTRVPTDYVDNNGFALGQWVKRQRAKYVGAGKGRPLNDPQTQILQGMPGWAWNAQDAKWEDGYAALDMFVRREGHACPSHDHMEDGFPLGSWTRRQRLDRHPRAKRLGMSEERQRRLEAVPGWRWRLPIGWNPATAKPRALDDRRPSDEAPSRLQSDSEE